MRLPRQRRVIFECKMLQALLQTPVVYLKRLWRSGTLSKMCSCAACTATRARVFALLLKCRHKLVGSSPSIVRSAVGASAAAPIKAGA